MSLLDALSNSEQPSPESWPDEAIACDLCGMWLNGPSQFEDHRRGKRHRTNFKENLRKQRLATIQASRARTERAAAEASKSP